MQSAKSIAIAACLLLAGCVHSGMREETFAPAYPEFDQHHDPIFGVFQGRIPCSGTSDDQIKLTLVLYRNKETRAAGTYWMGSVSLCELRHSDTPVETQGVWQMRQGVKDYPGATVYELDAAARADLRLYWQLNDNILLPLDDAMSPKAGNAAWGYMLSRDTAPYGPKTIRWRP
jgi:hypothetical protein